MKETELKYRIAKSPKSSQDTKKIFQAYLDLNNESVQDLLLKIFPTCEPETMAEARIRKVEQETDNDKAKCYLTLKSEGTLSREEKEIQITPQDFQRLRIKASAGDIEKERSEVALTDKIKAEIDIYQGKLNGLAMMEIEYQPTEIEAEKVREMAKSLFPDAEEVTEIKLYKNKELAKLKNIDELRTKLKAIHDDIEHSNDNKERKNMGQVIKIAVTGGPCGGKSEVIKHLKNRFGEQVTVLQEVATQLLEIPLEDGGIGVPGKDVEWSLEWQDEFQKRVVEKQLSDETLMTQIASLKDNGAKIMICDRGVLDGAAYVTGGRDELLETFNLDLESCFGLYDAVIHLNSLATDNPKLYDKLKHTNPSRYEDCETAKALDERIGLAYEGHPNLIRIPADGELEQKIELCEQIIRKMAQISDETKRDILETKPEEETNTELNKS